MAGCVPVVAVPVHSTEAGVRLEEFIDLKTELLFLNIAAMDQVHRVLPIYGGSKESLN